jgi:serine/threonine-protein kinase PknK
LSLDLKDLSLPPRYEPIRRLGRGGGGEVWAVRDRSSGRAYAFKLLAEEASEREMAALVREAVALSGLEGLGLPRVVRFGRLLGSGRPYLVREIVEGESLEVLLARGTEARAALEILARAADQLTVLHRAGLLHGDVKPANIIVEPEGSVVFVDLGLAAPWREGGAFAEGLTPRYAAPELFEGKPITVRAEVFALGVMLAEILESGALSLGSDLQAQLGEVAERAMARSPDDRYPSVDELSSEVRRVLGVPGPDAVAPGSALWPVSGIDGISSQILEAAQALAGGTTLRLSGPPGSGRSALIRRLAWSLGVLGRPVAFVDDGSSCATVQSEIDAHPSLDGAFVLIDDADGLDDEAIAAVRAALDAHARLVVVGGARCEAAKELLIPPLSEPVCLELVRRAVPSLTAGLQRRLVEAAEGRPGPLRRLVRLMASEAVASTADFDRVVGNAPLGDSSVPSEPLERAFYFLDRGRFNDASAALTTVPKREQDSVAAGIARGRLELGLGEERSAFERLQLLAERPDVAPDELCAIRLFRARARLGLGEYAPALEDLSQLKDRNDAVGTEAQTYLGLALSLVGNHEEARQQITLAVERARSAQLLRVEALGLASLGFVLQRADRIDEAQGTYRQALTACERAGDAGTLATVQTSLAGLLKVRGDIAGAIELFEAAVDMGRRSGRRSTARQALLNLANTDLYLGRLSRAQSNIATLREQSAQLPKVMLAQLLGLEGDLAARQGHHAEAASRFVACGDAYGELGRNLDAGEALLEAVLVASRSPHPSQAELRAQLSRAEQLLEGTPAHRPLLFLAQGRVASILGDELAARDKLDASIEAARAAHQREWLWRSLEARAELEERGGQPLLARRDREGALAALEEIGARLPRDLREVYWNDPRRKHLRGTVSGAVGHAATELSPFAPLSALPAASPTLSAGRRASSSTSSLSQIGGLTPLEQRLSRILEVNADLAGELDLERLTSKIIGHAVELLRAERGYVLLSEPDGSLTVHAARGAPGEPARAEFSRSIAEGVVASREPVVTLDARGDTRLKAFASVHQLLLESVACVPILSPSGFAIGALYLETRGRPGRHFERELPTLRAFADQVAIALENARLVHENRARADELSVANAELAEAEQRLRELLDGRTEQLKRTRQKLRDARETLFGHFGYQGLVGTSGAMRKVYALVDRVKDTDVPVLITGESGTGKEVVARAIHDASARSKAKMLAVNCGAIPENLLESELFGHVRGAFTGADRDRKGLFREAHGGSILLDEIGEMPMKMQAGLLRVLQEKCVRPVGGTTEEPVDVRILFATNRELEKMVQAGRFREDLYYRIHVVEIHLPSLRERSDDIPQLVDHFLGIFAARYKREKKTVSRDALRRLQAYGWPGNVRQLEHVLLNAWVMSEEQELSAEDLEVPDGFRPIPGERSPSVLKPQKKGSTSQHRRDERERIIEALRSCNWNRVKAAELSGIPRRTFYRRLREYGIQ